METLETYRARAEAESWTKIVVSGDADTYSVWSDVYAVGEHDSFELGSFGDFPSQWRDTVPGTARAFLLGRRLSEALGIAFDCADLFGGDRPVVARACTWEATYIAPQGVSTSKCGANDACDCYSDDHAFHEHAYRVCASLWSSQLQQLEVSIVLYDGQGHAVGPKQLLRWAPPAPIPAEMIRYVQRKARWRGSADQIVRGCIRRWHLGLSEFYDLLRAAFGIDASGVEILGFPWWWLWNINLTLRARRRETSRQLTREIRGARQSWTNEVGDVRLENRSAPLLPQ